MISCQTEYNNYEKISNSEVNTSKFFIDYLSNNSVIVDKFFKQIGDNYLFYEDVDIAVTEKGPSFLVPYGNTTTSEIKGLAIFPISCKKNSNEQIKLKKELEEPLIINKDNFEDKYSISERFIFSDCFASFQKKGLYVDTCLTRYLSLGNKPMIFNNPYDRKENGTKISNLQESRSNIATPRHCYRINVWFVVNSYNYWSGSWGNGELRVTLPSPDTYRRYLYNLLKIRGGSLLTWNYYYNSFIADIVLQNERVDELMFAFKTAFLEEHYNMTISYSYRKITDPTLPPVPPISKPNTGGGGSIYGGVPSNNNSQNKDTKIPNIEDLCKELKKKIKMKNPQKDIDSIWSTKSIHDLTTNSLSIEDYLEQVRKYNDTKEVLITYQIANGYQKASLKNMELGEHYNVLCRTMSPLTQWVLHSHTSDAVKAPSPRDLLTFLKEGLDGYCKSYKGEMVINCSYDKNKIYSFEKGDTTAMRNVYNAVKESIDEHTNNFNKNSEISHFLRKNNINKGSLEQQLLKAYAYLNLEYGNNKAFTLSDVTFSDKDVSNGILKRYYMYKYNVGKKTKYGLINCDD